ncbi:hypothetical protein [Mycobacterium sp.]|uniref:hypothetical protein n=1 Tax=Mycobacterium sp. TaxID=1785 RepID=UPI0031E0276C
MTAPHDTPGARPISVAELLARCGTAGAPPISGRRRRRRGNSDAVTVAELTGEMPVVKADIEPAETPRPDRSPDESGNGAPGPDDEGAAPGPYWSEPEPRWPTSPPPGLRAPGPERSSYPLPVRGSARTDADTADRVQSGAEEMNPDPVENHAAMPVDLMDTEVSEAEPVSEDSAYVRSYLRVSAGRLRRGKAAGEQDGGQADEEPGEDVDDIAGLVEARDDEDADLDARPRWTDTVLRGAVVVLQSLLAVAFGAGLFIAFDQLWRWNTIIALLLSVLVILGLVVTVRVVRKTEDIGSTLIAVAVGALVTLGPLALVQSG